MGTGIREASSDDAVVVASFFTSVYEVQHGSGTATGLEMLQRTVASLFSDVDPPTVFISECEGKVQGVVAVGHAEAPGSCELVAIQTHDSVQGRGVAQTLLRHVVASCATKGGEVLVTHVPVSDVRARGFLRREGFVVIADEAAAPSAGDGTLVTYWLDVATSLATPTLADEPTD